MNIFGFMEKWVVPQERPRYEQLTQQQFSELVMRIIKTASADIPVVDAVAATAQALGTQIGALVGFGYVPGAALEDMLAAAHETVDTFARDTLTSLPSSRT